jgi:hypothetical protein
MEFDACVGSSALEKPTDGANAHHRETVYPNRAAYADIPHFWSIGESVSVFESPGTLSTHTGAIWSFNKRLALPLGQLAVLASAPRWAQRVQQSEH